jgi:hypothetical protein
MILSLNLEVLWVCVHACAFAMFLEGQFYVYGDMIPD